MDRKKQLDYFVCVLDNIIARRGEFENNSVNPLDFFAFCGIVILLNYVRMGYAARKL